MYDPLEMRKSLGWSLVLFFCGVSGRGWDDIPLLQRRAVHEFLDSIDRFDHGYSRDEE